MHLVQDTKSIGSGMAQLLNLFCVKNNLISPINYNYRIDDRIPFETWLKNLKYVDNQFKKDYLGLEIAKLCNPGHIGICAYLASSCNTLSEYLSLPQKYISIWYDQELKKIKTKDGRITISWKTPDYYNSGSYIRETDISNELKVAIIYQRILQITKERKKVFEKIQLAIKTPKNVKVYEPYFHCPVVFNSSETVLVIYQDLYEKPLETKDPILLEILKKQADVMLNNMQKNSSFLDIVKQSVIKSIYIQDPRITIVASYLNMTPRALQKKLNAHGLCFQIILNTTRETLAKQYLKNIDNSILEIWQSKT